MTEHEIELALSPTYDQVAKAVEDICIAEGLVIQMRTSLKKYPGCTHWHLKRPKARGILEVTWWPRQGERPPPRLWLSIHGNRQADWIEERMHRIKALIEKQLNF